MSRVEDDETARLAAEVDARGALFGARRRRRAAHRLAALRTPAAVRALAAAYGGSPDRAVVSIAGTALVATGGDDGDTRLWRSPTPAGSWARPTSR